MMILIHSICIAFNGLGKFNIVDTATSVRAAILLCVITEMIATEYNMVLTCSIEIEGNF